MKWHGIKNTFYYVQYVKVKERLKWFQSKLAFVEDGRRHHRTEAVSDVHIFLKEVEFWLIEKDSEILKNTLIIMKKD